MSESKPPTSRAIAVIFGAAVSDDGVPSGALQRRVRSALELRPHFDSIYYIPTGGLGVGRRYTEAEVMQGMLEAEGVEQGRILQEGAATDTLASILNCTPIIRSIPEPAPVIVCSDKYHVWRCRIMFSLMGVTTIPWPMLSGRQSTGWRWWIYYCLREFIAIPVDLATLTWLKLARRS